MSSSTGKPTAFPGHGIIPDFTVPDSFIDDGASIPKIAQPFIGRPHDPAFKSAARGHDWFYRGNFPWMDFVLKGVKYTIPLRPSRRQVDNWFLKELAVNGVSWMKRTAMYVAVRLFAAPFWNGRSDRGYLDLEAIERMDWGYLDIEAIKEDP